MCLLVKSPNRGREGEGGEKGVGSIKSVAHFDKINGFKNYVLPLIIILYFAWFGSSERLEIHSGCPGPIY